MKCYITRTGSFLPGEPIDNGSLHRYIGVVGGEENVKRQVLAANGILERYYALDEEQTATYNVYGLAQRAAEACLNTGSPPLPITYLSAGSTYTPLSGPGISSILHGELSKHTLPNRPLEINSNAGICSSAATAVVNASRAIRLGEHDAALCIGTEHASEILKSSAIQLPRDTQMIESDLKRSRWFMAVFLRFMLSDGAGAWLLQNRPATSGVSFEIDWTFARSYANEAPLCMKLENDTALLSQDVDILSKHLFVCAEKFVAEALERQRETVASYRMVLPHISSFFFRRKMEKLIRKFSVGTEPDVDYWTNLATAGNTGAASIFIMLDEFIRTQTFEDGDRLLLFIPESGQFNFVLISLTAVSVEA